MEDYTSNGIAFTEEISSPDGASFILFPEAIHTTVDIKRAIAEIKYNRDVIHLHVATEEDRDRLYISKVFRNPLVHEYRWYEINVDPNLIRNERRKGTTTEDYIRSFVIPFKEHTKNSMIQKYGDEILNF